MKKMKLSVRNAAEGYALLLLPLLVGCAVFYAVPFLLVARKSAYAGTFGGAQELAVAENYRGLLENGAFRLAMGNTVKFLALALPLMILVSFAIALMLKDHAQKHSALKSVLLLPYIMPVVGSVALVIAPVELWACSCCLLRRERRGMAAVNAVLAAAVVFLTFQLLGKIDLPSSLMPKENIFELGYYVQELRMVTDALRELGNPAPDILAAMEEAGRSTLRAALLGFLIPPAVIALELLTTRRKKKA